MKVICKSCKKQIDIDKYDFCYHCGESIPDIEELRKAQQAKIGTKIRDAQGLNGISEIILKALPVIALAVIWLIQRILNG